MSTGRPLMFLDVDGVVALQDPQVPVVQHTVSAYGRWRRDLLVPVAATQILRDLSERFDCVWAGPWAHTAHPALREVLDLPREPWPWIGVQFHKLGALRAFAAGRPWAWLDDGIDDLGVLPEPADGVLVRLDSRRGITDVDPRVLLAQVSALGVPALRRS